LPAVRAFFVEREPRDSLPHAPHQNPKLRSTDHLNSQPQRKRRYGRHAYEPEVFVEQSRLFIERIDHNRSGGSERIRYNE
jgi:hypothetical protein